MNDPRALRAVDALAVAACAALAALYVTPHILDADEAIFATCALRMEALGLPPYVGGWEHKPPGIFWIYEALLRPWHEGGLVWVHAASALAWVATAWICGIGARRLCGAAAFAPAVVAYGLLRSLGETKAGAANTEAFLSPFLAAGLLLLLLPGARKRTLLAGGAALGAAVLLKAPVAMYGPAIAAAVWLLRGGREALRATWLGAAGALAVLLPAMAWIIASGAWAEARLLNLDANRIYMEHGPPVTVAVVAARVAGEIGIAAAPWLLALAAAVIAFVRPRRLGEGDAPRRWTVAIALLLGAGLFQVSLGGLFFRHYWLMVHPLLAVGAAAGVVALAFPRDTGRPDLRGVAVCALAVGALWLPAQWTDKRRLARSFLLRDADSPYEPAEFRRIAQAVQRRSGEDDSVFVWGWNPELYLLAERTPASRHVTCHFLTGALRPDVRNGDAPPDPDVLPPAWDLLFQDLERSRPRLLVDTTATGWRHWDLFPMEKFPRLASYVAAHYDLAETVEKATIWVRR